MFNTLIVSTTGSIARIALNRPERKNAIGPEMINELLHALDRAQADANVRVIVLTGEGKAFCAGGDLGQMSGDATTGSDPLSLRGDYADLLLAMIRCTRPIIARVHGAAMGGGLGLVASSAFAIAAGEAQLGTPEINVGLFPMMIMAVLARTMPRRRLLEMMLLGQKIPADEALRLGLLNRVVPASELDATVDSLANDLAQKSPTAIARGLSAYATVGDLALAEALPWLRDQLYELLQTDDAREGLMAFAQKRAPQWTGR